MKSKRWVLFACAFVSALCSVRVAESQSRHAWLPPYGIDRVGQMGRNEGLEADAVARPDRVLNPVDLGAIFVPHDWLLLEGDQTAQITIAAISHGNDERATRVRTWFASKPDQVAVKPFPLSSDKRDDVTLKLEKISFDVDRDELHVAIERSDGKVLWEKTIQTMIVRQRPDWPRFGAVSTKLRYDLPISVRQENGQFTTLDYSKGWNDSLNDVVVCLPRGGRFVFWRGSCYVPFWAGRHNTGLSYEWAETKPPADGFKDCVEPLMDKELRYGRVEILESTSSRIHVRWTYQSCDFNYKVWGDAATEDFYFYPDGFGTRVLTLQSALDSEYELSEFIIMTPPGAYPFEMLPTRLIDVLFLDGEKREIDFPYDPVRQSAKLKSREQTAAYRVRLHRDDPEAAIYYHPTDKQLPPVVFAGFLDKGQVVTPCYWGSHWPLGRGQTTGGAIDDRIHLTPSHNSIMSWAMQQPTPLREARLETLDTLGRVKPMRRQTWAWLIGLSDASDERVREWGKSFSRPPELELTGARLASESYVLERRAMGLVAESTCVSIKLRPADPCVNPVFEITNHTAPLRDVTLNGATLPSQDWTWDGKTVWLNQTLTAPSTLQLNFEE